MNILISTACGQDKVSYIKNLRTMYPKHEGHVIVGIDMSDGTAPADLDYFHLVPPGTAGEYLPRIQSLIKSYAIDVFIPCSDPEVVAVSGVDLGCSVLTTHYESIRAGQVFDKLECVEMLRGKCSSLVIPATSTVNTYADITKYITELDSIVLKPVNGYGSRGLMVVHTEFDDFKNIMQKERSPEMSYDRFFNLVKYYGDAILSTGYLVQQYWSGASINVECVAFDGRLYACVPHLRSGYRWGRLDEGTLHYDPEIEKCAREIIKYLGITSGVFNFEVNYTSPESGELGLVEINPRVSAVHSQCKFLGYDIIENGLKVAQGIEPDIYLGDDVQFNSGRLGYVITENERGVIYDNG